jgi:glutathione S-transferase
MILYGSPLSPFVRKVLIYAAEKGLEIELKAAFPGSTDAEFRRISPFGKIPGFVDGDYSLCDSTAIIAYLEARYPGPELIPTEARARGQAVWFDEFGDTILVGAIAKCFFNRVAAPLLGRPQDLAAADIAERDELPPIFDWLETQMRPGGHLVGDGLTIADIAVVSPFVNLRHCAPELDSARYPKLAAWVEDWLARDSLSPLFAREVKILSRGR